MNKFVPEGFKAPFQVEMPFFTLRKLTVDEVVKDYAAVMSSRESLRRIFYESDTWPSDDMTLEENYNDLLVHQEEFDNNEGFAYTIVTPDDSRCIGCFYLFPFAFDAFDSKVYYWFVDDVAETLTSPFQAFIEKWIPETFGHEKIIYPGRSISHRDYEQMVIELKASL